MINKFNLKPNERIDEIMGLSLDNKASSIISYFLNELSVNSDFKSFADECYWKEVLMEYNKRNRYDK